MGGVSDFIGQWALEAGNPAKLEAGSIGAHNTEGEFFACGLKLLYFAIYQTPVKNTGRWFYVRPIVPAITGTYLVGIGSVKIPILYKTFTRVY